MRKGKRCINWCIAAGPTKEYERMLLEELKFKVETTEACGYRMDGYNEVQYGTVERIYGEGVFDRMSERARQNYLRKVDMSER
jgi:hypothetical protein